MRSLRKIVFINSAHIRYAEVMLDGNVHFIGTQGVGKSTLLRAILFFYNADKAHLGIPREMKSFDEFYLPAPDSYIVYEVDHEHGPFCVLVLRSQGRACYRFIDAPYRKEWLIDGRGEVTTEYRVLSARLGKIFMSKLVDRYELYRDILYGNSKETGKDFLRFQLMETRNYQNIYRSIQNVFLNSRLDADFIKDIIIRSMSEQEASVNLGYFRGQVSDFEQEYNDISKWYRTNARQESPVRKQADAVIQAYHDVLYLRKQVSDLCGELNYALRCANERRPVLQARLTERFSELTHQRSLLEEVQSKYETEKADLNKDIGAVDENLRKAREKRAFYASRGIEEVILRCGKRQELSIRLESLSRRLSVLTGRYEDITSKFSRLIEAEKDASSAFRQVKEKEKNEARERSLNLKEKSLEELNTRKAELETLYQDRMAVIQDGIQALRGEHEECARELFALESFQPYRSQTDELQRQLQRLSERSAVLEGEIKSQKSEAGKLQAEYERREIQESTSFEQRIKEKNDAITVLRAGIHDLDTLLSRTRGSLYEWLTGHVQGWEKNIGRVISEDRVLYQTGLKPELRGQDGTLYGVFLDLSDLPMSVRTPDDLMAKRAEKEKALEGLLGDAASLQHDKQEALSLLKRQYAPKLKQIRESCSMNQAESQAIPSRRKAIQVKMDDFERRTEQERKARRTGLSERRDSIAHRIAEKETELARTRSQKDMRLKEAARAYSAEKEEIEASFRLEAERIETEVRNREALRESNVERLRAQELDELKGKGADTSAVEECHAQIEQVRSELGFISTHAELVTRYHIDKEEYLDREETFRSDRKALSDNLSLLGEKHAQRQEAYRKRIADLVQETGAIQAEMDRIGVELKEAATFIGDPKLCPSMLRETPEISTSKTPSQAVRELTGLIVSRHNRQDALKQGINLFKSNFSAKNTFSFKTSLNLDQDYLDFASNLDDFIQNNMIEVYRSRTSERYTHILARISAEIGDLARHESDVEKIINDINTDFRDKNFVTAIKLIALRSRQTSDKMVLLMRRIKDFHDENQFAMGQVNLFTTSDREDVNSKAVDCILELMKTLNGNPDRQLLTLSDMFQLEFRVRENDNDTEWTSKLSHVGSEGTDTLVKAMVNIMLVNVFKEKVSKKFGDFRIHCMMDEIGKLHPQNVKGILEFANSRNILLINSSPTTYNVSDYRYTYLLDKDRKSNTVVHSLISKK